MRRIGPVVIVSLLVNFFLFFMMTRMLAGKKLKPKEILETQSIEIIDLKTQDKSPEKIKKPKRPLLPETPPPLKISTLPPLTRPRPKPKPKPPPEKIKVEPPPEPIPVPIPIPLPEPIVVEEIPIPEPILEPIPDPIPEVEPPPPEPVVEPVPEKIVEPEPPLEETIPPVKEVQTVEEVVPLPEDIPPVEDLPLDEEVQTVEDVPLVQVKVAVSPLKNIEAIVDDQEEVLEADAIEEEVIEVDVRPLLRTQPRYPRRAIRAKLEGMVTIEFTILTDGSVSDPIVIASAPPKVFDQAALSAIRKWKFSPKQVKGQTVARRAIQNIRFSLKSRKK